MFYQSLNSIALEKKERLEGSGHVDMKKHPQDSPLRIKKRHLVAVHESKIKRVANNVKNMTGAIRFSSKKKRKIVSIATQYQIVSKMKLFVDDLH